MNNGQIRCIFFQLPSTLNLQNPSLCKNASRLFSMILRNLNLIIWAIKQMKPHCENHNQTQSKKSSDGLESSKAAGVPGHCFLSIYRALSFWFCFREFLNGLYLKSRLHLTCFTLYELKSNYLKFQALQGLLWQQPWGYSDIFRPAALLGV